MPTQEQAGMRMIWSVSCEGHKEDLTGPTVDQEDNVSMACEDIGDSAAVFFWGGGILVESGSSSIGGDMRREIEQLKEELLRLKRKHGEPQVKGPDPPDLVEIGYSQLGQAERVIDGDHLVEEPAQTTPGSAEPDHTRSWIPKPEIYDGTNSVNEYLTHFEEVSRINGWSSEMKRNYLLVGVSLRGAAHRHFYMMWVLTV